MAVSLFLFECVTSGKLDCERCLSSRKFCSTCDGSSEQRETRARKGGFPLSRKFYVRTNVNLAGFTYVNEIRSIV